MSNKDAGRKRGRRGETSAYVMPLRMPEDLAKRGDEAARRRGLSFAEWIRDAMRKALGDG